MKNKNKDQIFYAPNHQSAIDRKYKFRSTSAVLKFNKTVKCKTEGCKKYYTVTKWRTGVDRDYCKTHREEIHEAEAEQMVKEIEERELEERINNFKLEI